MCKYTLKVISKWFKLNLEVYTVCFFPQHELTLTKLQLLICFVIKVKVSGKKLGMNLK